MASTNKTHSKFVNFPGPLKGVIENLAFQSIGGHATISHGLAKRMLEETNWRGQRRVSPARVQGIARKVRTGEWNPSLSMIEFAVRPDGSVSLVNGQHRLTYAIDNKTDLNTAVRIVAAQNDDDVQTIYSVIDSKESARSKAEVIHAMNLNERLGCSVPTANAAFDAMAIIINEMEPLGRGFFSYLAKDATARLAEIGDWADVIRVWDSILAYAPGYMRRHLRTQSVTAVALYTLRHAPAKAREFWTSLAKDDGLRQGEPQKTLINHLMNSGSQSLTGKECIQRVTTAWNAYIDGRTFKAIKCHEDSPITIKGTPKAEAKV